MVKGFRRESKRRQQELTKREVDQLSEAVIYDGGELCMLEQTSKTRLMIVTVLERKLLEVTLK